MIHSLSKELSRKSFSLCCTTKERALFTKSQWFASPKLFLVYRLSIWCYQISWSLGYIIYLLLHFPDRLNRIHRYFTSWADIVNVLYYSTALGLCILTACRRKGKSEENGSVKRLRSLTWLLHTVAINSSVIVAMIFWLFVSSKFNDGKLRSVFNIHRHAISNLFILIDFCIVATPVRLFHVAYSYMYGLVYALATIFMYYLGDTPHVYPFMNWEKHPGKAVLVTVVVAGIVPTILQCLFYFLHVLKRKTATFCLKGTDKNIDTDDRVVTEALV